MLCSPCTVPSWKASSPSAPPCINAPRKVGGTLLPNGIPTATSPSQPITSLKAWLLKSNHSPLKDISALFREKHRPNCLSDQIRSTGLLIQKASFPPYHWLPPGHMPDHHCPCPSHSRKT